MKSMTENELQELSHLSASDKREFLIRQKTQQYSDQLKITKKQIRRLEKVRKRISRDHFKQQIISQLLATDKEQLTRNTSAADEALTIIQKATKYKLNSYEQQADSLKELNKNIDQRIAEVEGKIKNLHETVLEWQTANYIVNTRCQSSVLDNIESFQTWNQHIPILNTYLSNESKIHYSIYLSAQLLGLIDELDAQKDIKQILQDFGEKNYPDINKTKALPLKQINDNRQTRSDAFDQLHWKLIKQLRYYVRQCDNLQDEIEEREILRGKLVTIAMELKNCIEKDYHHCLEVSDHEAKLPIDKILFFLKSFSLEDKEYTSQLVFNNYQTEEDTNQLSQESPQQPQQQRQQQQSSPKKQKLKPMFPMTHKETDLLEVLEARYEITAKDPKRVKIPKKGKDILLSILEDRLKKKKESPTEGEHPSPSPMNRSPRPGKPVSPLLKAVTEEKDGHDAFLMNPKEEGKIGEGEEVSNQPSWEFPQQQNSSLDQSSLISSLSDSLVHGLLSTIEQAPPSQNPVVVSNAAPAPPPSQKDTSTGPTKRPKSSGHHFRTSKTDQNELETGENKEKRISPLPFPPKNVKNLLEEYRLETQQKPYRTPLQHTRRYVESIKPEIESAIDNIYPEIQFVFNTLLSPPFLQGSTTTEIVEAIQKLQSSRQLHASNNTANQLSEALQQSTMTHIDPVLKQSLETVIEGLHAMRALQQNCATVASEAIITVSSLLGKMKVQDEKREVTSLESVSEIDQYLAAQQLIAEISDQFARNKSMLESWFIASSVEEFKIAKRQLEEKFQSLGLPTVPPSKEKKTQKNSAQSGSMTASEKKASNVDKSRLDTNSFSEGSSLSPVKGPLAKIVETDREEEEEDEDNDEDNEEEDEGEEGATVNDPVERAEMKDQQYRELITRNRLNTEIIRKSFESPQILDLISVGEDETERSIHDFLQQSEQLLTSINDTIRQDDEKSVEFQEKFPHPAGNAVTEESRNLPIQSISVDNISYNALNAVMTFEDAPGKIIPQSEKRTAKDQEARPKTSRGNVSSKESSSRPVSSALRYDSDEYREYDDIVKLVKLELVMRGDLYHVSFQYLSKKKQLFILARYHIQRGMFREYRFFLPLKVYASLIDLAIDACQPFLYQDSLKACQAIIDHFSLELIEKNAYFEYLHAKELSLLTASLPLEDMEKLLQAYEEQRISMTHAINHQRQQEHILSEDNTSLKILTVRNREGKLVAFGIPVIKALREREKSK